MANRVLNHAQETPRHRRRRRLLHSRTQSPTLQIPGRIQKIQGIKQSRCRVPPRKVKIAPHDTFSFKNSDVEARALKDKLELKAVKVDRLATRRWRRRLELYDKLVRGELSDEEDKEKYCVDFFRKGFLQEEPQQRRAEYASDKAGDDDENEDGPFSNSRFVGPGRTAGVVDNDEHKRFVR